MEMDFLYECPHVAPSVGPAQYCGDPDLIMLREDLADELGAIVGYLECADEIRDRRVSEQFRETASDETGHFISLMRLIASLDPVQAEELKKQGLTLLTIFGEPAFSLKSPCHGCFGKDQAGHSNERKPYFDDQDHYSDDKKHNSDEKKHYSGDKKQHYSEDKKHYPVDPKALECLRNAIRDELHAINAYQKQVQASVNPVVQNLLTTIMNKEKEHVAEFIQLFYKLEHS
jgi:rubrerythrin